MSQPWRDPPRFDPLSRLRKFGAKPSVSEHHQQLLRLLQSQEAAEVLQGLAQLSSELLMAQDDVLSAFPLELLMPPLVNCLQKDGLEDISLHALTCLNHLTEAHPSACLLIADSAGIPALCRKLANLSYIDITEQAINLLEKLSFEFAPQILAEDGLSSLLSVFDFCEAAIQKKVLSVVVSLARGVQSQELFDRKVVPVLPTVAALLSFRGKELTPVNEKALEFCLALVTAVDRFSRDSAGRNLRVLREQGVVRCALELGQEDRALWPLLFRLFTALCRGSGEVLRDFIDCGGSELVATSLDDDSEDEKPRLAAYVMDALQLIDSLLPCAKSSQCVAEVYAASPHLLQKLAQAVLPKLFSLYDRFVNRAVRQYALDILEKLIAQERTTLLLPPAQLAAFLAEVLRGRDLHNVAKALRIAKDLLESVPQLVAGMFTREGVMARIASLSTSPVPVEPAPHSLLLSESAHRSRLRQLLEGADSHTDPRLLEHYMRLLRRRDTDDDFPEAEADLRKEIDALAKEVTAAHRKLDQSNDCEVLGQVQALAEMIKSCESDQPEAVVQPLVRLVMSAHGVSAFEVTAADLPSALWTWLTCGQDFSDSAVPLKRLTAIAKRVRGFAALLGSNNPAFAGVVGLLGEAVAREQQLPLTLYESPVGGSQLLMGLRSLTQRVFVQLVYSPAEASDSMDPALRSDFESKNALFAAVSPLSIALEQFQPVSVLAATLTSARSRDDLRQFRGRWGVFARLQERPDARRFFVDFGFRADGTEDWLAAAPEDLPPAGDSATASLSASVLTAQLFLNGTEVSPNTTIFELCNRVGELDEQLVLQFGFKAPTAEIVEESSHFAKSEEAQLWLTLKEASSCGLSENDSLSAGLRLLKLLHTLSADWPLRFPTDCADRFLSGRLTALLAKQTQDAVAVIGHTAPAWVWTLPVQCAFAFPFEARCQLFRVAGVRADRALLTCAKRLKVGGDVLQLKAQRQKVRVDRTCILETAINTFSDVALLRSAALEFDYEAEEGTGAGPTLEFYSLTATSIRNLCIWRDTGETCGLFPAPDVTDVSLFAFAGKFVGKAISEDKVVDLPFSPAFWKLVFGRSLSLCDLRDVDGTLLRHLQALTRRDDVAELALTFVLPGTDSPLKPKGADILVTCESITEYVQLVAERILMQTAAARAFRDGLSMLVSVPLLSCFSGEELETILCGEGGAWDIATLTEAVVPAHGYTRTSAVYLHLLSAMSKLNAVERRQCLQFLTGAPRLPIGGFRVLNPPLTVVRKTVSGPADCYLPSVMTCQNYLKLPEYSSEAVVARQLRYACSEARETFHLT